MTTLYLGKSFWAVPLCALLLIIVAIPARAQIPRTLSYQGILTATNGTVVPDGNYSITFRLYDSLNAGTSRWTETQDVAVSKGIFSVILGNVNPISLAFDKQYWLGITVGSGSEMTPRIQLTSSAYSFRARCVDSLENGKAVKSINALKDSVTLAAGSNVTITSSGNTLTISATGGGGGTITGVTAGTGLYGGGTSGNVTVGIADGGVGANQISGNAITKDKVANGQVVKSINTLRDSVTIAAGSNVTITPTGNTLTIAAASGGGGTITGVTAGTGLTGGGSSGNVTLGLSVPLSISGALSQAIFSASNTSSNSGSYGVVGQSSNSFGVYGISTSAFGYGVYGINEASNSIGSLGMDNYGVYGQTGSTVGGLGVLLFSAPYGVYGSTSSSTGTSVYGVNYSSTTSGYLGSSNYGAYGQDQTSGNYGYLGSANYGVYGFSNSGDYGYLGSANYGVYGFSPSNYGVDGESTNATGVVGRTSSSSGYGIWGYNSYSGNYGQLAGPGFGAYGYSATGDWVDGYSTSGDGVIGGTSSGKAGYFAGNVYIAGGYTATGTKSAEVKTRDGSSVRLACEEAAGVYFADYGTSQLSSGRAHISIDPTFLQTVTIDALHPMMVFIQVEGDCKGVYVTNKTGTSFDVAELQGGTSNVGFSYRIVCKRKYFEDERLATPNQDDAYNETMVEKVWPEVIAERQKMESKMKIMEEENKAMQNKGNAHPVR